MAGSGEPIVVLDNERRIVAVSEAAVRTLDDASPGRRLSDLVDALAKTLDVPRRPRLSIGVSMLSDLPATAGGPELMKEADAKLYTTKSTRKATKGADPRAA